MYPSFISDCRSLFILYNSKEICLLLFSEIADHSLLLYSNTAENYGEISFISLTLQICLSFFISWTLQVSHIFISPTLQTSFILQPSKPAGLSLLHLSKTKVKLSDLQLSQSPDLQIIYLLHLPTIKWELFIFNSNQLTISFNPFRPAPTLLQFYFFREYVTMWGCEVADCLCLLSRILIFISRRDCYEVPNVYFDYKWIL